MANFDILENPKFEKEIRKFETTDPGHADVFNPVIQALVNNDTFLKMFAEQLSRRVDETYQQSTGYADQKIAELINGASSTMDTLAEIEKAMTAHKSVVDALDAAIGKKANAAEFDSHVKDSTAHITATERNTWNSKANGNHTHDDRYYTEAEIDNKLNGKANSSHTHDYLPKSGGEVNSLRLNDVPLFMNHSTRTHIGAWNNPYAINFCINQGNNESEDMTILYQASYSSGTRQFFPGNNGTFNLGISSYRWNNVYAANGTIQTSDRNMKKDIHYLDDAIIPFFMGLRPAQYRMKDGTSGRIHYGMIAQDVEELMEKLGIDSRDFAGFIKSPECKEVTETYKNGKEYTVIKEVDDGEHYNYSLRYDEFISPLIKMVQILYKLSQEQAQTIQNLSARLESIEQCQGLK